MDVVDYPSGGQPVFVPAQLDNVTVIEGQRSTLLCRVYGDVSTRLQVCVCVCVCVCPNVAVTLYFIASQTLLVGLQSLAITEFRSPVPGKHARSVADYRRACKQTQPAPCTKPMSLTLINKWSKYFNTRPHRRRTRAVQSYSPVCAPI